MNEEKELREIVSYWVKKSMDSLDAAEDELKAGRLSFSVNRIYYACFYIVTAVLLQEKLRFKKHYGVRAAFYKHFVKRGLISRERGQLYDRLFEERQRGDYIVLDSFEKEIVTKWFNQAMEFVETVKLLLND